MAAQEEQTETLQVWEKQPELTAQELQERNAHVIALTDEIMPEELEAFLPQGVVDVDLDQAQAHTDPWKVAQTHGITEAQIQQTALADTFLLEERQQVGQPELVAPNLAEPQQVEIDQDLRLQEPAPVAQDVDQPKQVALNLTEEHPIVNQEQVTLGNTQTGNTAVLENEQVSAAFSTTTPGQPGTSVIEGNAGSVGTAPIAQPVTVASAEFINWDTLDLGAAPKTASRLPEQQAV
jgi:hypothetical protein